jgi:hypothetical protein
MNTRIALIMAALFVCMAAKAQTSTTDDGTAGPLNTRDAKEKEKEEKRQEKEAAKAAKAARDPAEVIAEKEAKKEKKVEAKQEVRQEKAAAAAAAPPKQHKPVNFDLGLSVGGNNMNVGVHQDASGHTQVGTGVNGTNMGVQVGKGPNGQRTVGVSGSGPNGNTVGTTISGDGSGHVTGGGMNVTDANGNSAGFNAAAGGGNNNVNGGSNMGGNNSTQPVPVTCNGVYPMSTADFTAIMGTISIQPDDSTKLNAAEQGGYGKCFTAAQVKQVCKAFHADETKLAFAEYMYGNCADQVNYSTLKGVFLYMASVQSLNNYMQTAK